MPRRKPRLEEIRPDALEIYDEMEDLIQRARDIQVRMAELAFAAGATWDEIGGVRDETGDAVAKRVRRRRSGQP